ncbi:stage V sporulation protein AA [Alkaliphilus metalliredigens QYMF]|uniref:Stage V sporulation protein AA n=1 Tax=Alkaliphilus metalliredigens (strain QYMF) TaxID=293826 RepID=A6TQA6_ALKMQ|nr:stage V sporulation protein AA [Alkaliphilus metalliredigens QYMF]
MNTKKLMLKDLIDIVAVPEIKQQIENINYPLKDNVNQDHHIISMLNIIESIGRVYPGCNTTIIGESNILVKNIGNVEKKDTYKLLRVGVICFLLFIGSITAIINFHSDVNMREAHGTIYKIITGEENERPLLLQIPYSIGIGVGMAVFFNHIFRKKINQEPSPLEVEIYSYQQSLDEYIINNNEERNRRDKDG